MTPAREMFASLEPGDLLHNGSHLYLCEAVFLECVKKLIPPHFVAYELATAQLVRLEENMAPSSDRIVAPIEDLVHWDKVFPTRAEA